MKLNQLCNIFCKFAEKIEIYREDSSKSGIDEARDVLYYYLKNYFPEIKDVLERTGKRFKFKLIKSTSDKFEDYFQFEIEPKATKHLKDAPADEFGETKYVEYKNPSQAISEIPADPSLAYRGMSFEEWENIKKHGFIKSIGAYNIGKGQAGYTFFADNPGTALMYSNSFAPWIFKISHNKPGVVIAIDKRNLLSSENDPKAIPEGELATRELVPVSDIKKIWFVIASEKRKTMRFELFKKKHPSEQTNKSKWKIDASSNIQAPYYSIIDVSERHL